MTYTTNYLVAARFDTNKAKRAAKIGVKVITEAGSMSFIERGVPSTSSNKTEIRLAPTGSGNAIHYETIEQFPEPRVYYLKYEGSTGVISERFILAVDRVKGGSHEYLGGFDHGTQKTFRYDRILEMEDLGPVEKSTAAISD